MARSEPLRTSLGALSARARLRLCAFPGPETVVTPFPGSVSHVTPLFPSPALLVGKPYSGRKAQRLAKASWETLE